MKGIVCEDLQNDIQIKNGKEKGTQVVTFKATSEVTKEQAIEAMGKKANKFVVMSLKKEDS
ncbi:MAG: hypothetical protein ACI9QL_002556 [Candidatus Omnitrophota bacterium]